MDDDTIEFLRDVASAVLKVCDKHIARRGAKPKEEPAPKVDPALPDTRLIPLKEWSKHHSWPTEGAFRHLIFMRHKNGAGYFIRKCGKRVLICEKSFFKWTEMSPEERITASPEATAFRQKYKMR